MDRHVQPWSETCKGGDFAVDGLDLGFPHPVENKRSSERLIRAQGKGAIGRANGLNNASGHWSLGVSGKSEKTGGKESGG
jgi:hypothetical protein